MADEKTTSVKVSETVWQELHSRKQLGDTMDDVLRRELGIGVDDDSDLPRAVAEYLDQLDVSADERDAVEAMWRYVREDAPVSPQDIRDDVYPGHEAGKGNVDWWWKKLSEHLDDAPMVDRASQRRYEFAE